MLKFIFIAWLVFFFSPSFAFEGTSQLNKADSVKSSNPQLFNQLLSELNAHKEKLNQGERLHLKLLNAYQYLYRGDLEAAKKIYQELLNFNNEEVKLRSLSSLLNMYAFTRNWTDGLKTTVRLTSLLKKPISKKYKHTALFNIAQFYNQIGNFDDAIKKLDTILSQSPSIRNQCIAMMAKIEALENKGELKTEDSIIDKSTKFCKQAKEPIAVVKIKEYKARLQLKDNDLSGAAETLNALLEIVNKIDYSRGKALAYSLMAEVMHQRKSPRIAKDYALEAIELNESVKYNKSVISSLHTLYNLEKEAGNFERALDYYEKFSKNDRTYLDSIKAKELAIQQVLHDTAQQNSQIELLDKENTLLKIQNDLAEQQAENDRLALVMIVLVLILISIWAHKNRRLAYELKVLAQQDELTGIANRHHFTQEAVEAINYCKKHSQPVAYILFDLDHFKRINDNFGHPTGDWALKAVAKAALSACRSNDLIGRLGGEEFAILLPNCTVEQAKKLAEHCRKAIANVDSTPSGYKFELTASFGLTDSNRCNYNLDKMYACADAALYCSKDSGRNRIYLFDEEMQIPKPQ